MVVSRQSAKFQMNLFKGLSTSGVSVIAFMPIKPIYAEKIVSGDKLYEFRKAAIRDDLTHIIIYASSPVKKIIGVAEVESVKISSPTAIWESTKHSAGISRKGYREYFRGKKRAYAIQIKKVLALHNCISPNEINNGFKVPQSFTYVDDAFFKKVLKKGKGANVR